MHWRLAIAIVFILVAGAAGLATGAQEQRIERSRVPEPVLKAVEARYPGATLREFESETEEGELVYEVTLDAEPGQELEVVVSPEGRVLVEEQEIEIDALPAAVREGLASSKYASAKVVWLERVTEIGKATTFEIVVEHENVRHELLFSETGQLRKDDTAARDESAPAPGPRD